MMQPTLRRSPSQGGSPGQRAPPKTYGEQRGPMRNLLRRVLSSSSISGSSPARQPLVPLAPPPIESPGSFASDVSEEEILSITSKRQRLSRSGSWLSSLAQQSEADPEGSFRPPPIHTVQSLEGSELSDVVRPIARDDESGAPCTPGNLSLFRHASAPFRSSRLGVPAMSLVAPGLYVGDEHAAASEARLRMDGVTHVLNCTSKPNAALEAAGCSISYLRLDLLDHPSDMPRMKTVLRSGVDFIRGARDAGGVVLVHCHRGISRSVTLAMAYLIEEEQRSADSVFETVRASRRIADPNLGYWCAMKEWENAVLPSHVIRSRSSCSRVSPSPRPLSRAG